MRMAMAGLPRGGRSGRPPKGLRGAKCKLPPLDFFPIDMPPLLEHIP